MNQTIIQYPKILVFDYGYVFWRVNVKQNTKEVHYSLPHGGCRIDEPIGYEVSVEGLEAKIYRYNFMKDEPQYEPLHTRNYDQFFYESDDNIFLTKEEAETGMETKRAELDKQLTSEHAKWIKDDAEMWAYCLASWEDHDKEYKPRLRFLHKRKGLCETCRDSPLHPDPRIN